MGQTSTQAKREVDETRAHLAQTLDALQLKARRNLDLRTQIQTNRAVQASVAAIVLGLAGLALLAYQRRSRRSAPERLARRLKLNELRDRVKDFAEDAAAWTVAQKRIVKADRKNERPDAERREPIARRLLVSAAQAAVTALAAGYAKKLVGGGGPPRERERPGRSKAH